MIEFLKLAFVFFTGSVLGWITELLYRRMAHKKWINPGFLVGPYLPLYGFGLTALYLFCQIDFGFSSVAVEKITLILVLTVVTTLLEYITGLIFIKQLKVQLWDYSDRWGNVQGIICPLFTLFWGIISAVYCLFIHDGLIVAANFVGAHPEYSFFIGVLAGIFILDNCYSFHLVSKVRAWAKKNQVVIRYEHLRLAVKTRAEELKSKANFIFSLRSKSGIEEELEHYSKGEKQSHKWTFFKRNKSGDAQQD